MTDIRKQYFINRFDKSTNPLAIVGPVKLPFENIWNCFLRLCTVSHILNVGKLRLLFMQMRPAYVLLNITGFDIELLDAQMSLHSKWFKQCKFAIPNLRFKWRSFSSAISSPSQNMSFQKIHLQYIPEHTNRNLVSPVKKVWLNKRSSAGLKLDYLETKTAENWM